jgi:hypothetical protein
MMLQRTVEKLYGKRHHPRWHWYDFALVLINTFWFLYLAPDFFNPFLDLGLSDLSVYGDLSITKSLFYN